MSDPPVPAHAGLDGVCASAWVKGFACDPAARSWAPWLGATFVIVIIIVAIMYVMPTIIAFRRGCTWRWCVALLNLAMRLSGLGWALALWMALTGSVEPSRDSRLRFPRTTPTAGQPDTRGVSLPGLYQPTAEGIPGLTARRHTGDPPLSVATASSSHRAFE